MERIVSLNSRNWSLARQLIVLQLCVVVIAVAIEAMVAIYRGPLTAASVEQRQVLGLVTLTEVALLVGISGSLFVAEGVRRQTFDMEPAEIARRYQHHDAMLHAVREGLIITDVNGGVVLANDEARRLLGLADGCADAPLRDQVAGAEWAAAETPVMDQLQYAAGRVLMVSRSQAEVDGKPAGMVTTLRDRTELQEALLELSEARVLANELRKQAHEHANHLQMVINLIETGEYDEAVGVCTRYADTPQMLSTQVLRQVADPVLAARLQISHAWAERHGVELRLAGTLELAGRDSSGDLADIVGTLVDNAIEATSDSGQGRWVQLSLVHGTDACLRITVRDNGPGITADPIEQVFMPGWTTKGSRHGYGLARVRDKIWHLRGTITAHNDGGAVFEVCIPIPREQVEE
jgi:two-component system, CitB family, sensor kinase